jgi:hypothetical protein
MSKYGYAVSLRLWHAALNPSEVTAVLGMSPRHSWKAGDPRKTAQGRPLTGIRNEGFWTAELFSREVSEFSLPDAIASSLDRLQPHKAYLQELHASGVRLEFFIGWFFDSGNSGDVFEPEFLGRLADFKIALSMDVYPASKEFWSEGLGRA